MGYVMQSFNTNCGNKIINRCCVSGPNLTVLHLKRTQKRKVLVVSTAFKQHALQHKFGYDDIVFNSTCFNVSNIIVSYKMFDNR